MASPTWGPDKNRPAPGVAKRQLEEAGFGLRRRTGCWSVSMAKSAPTEQAAVDLGARQPSSLVRGSGGSGGRVFEWACSQKAVVPRIGRNRNILIKRSHSPLGSELEGSIAGEL